MHVLEHARGGLADVGAREEPLEARDGARLARPLRQHVRVRVDRAARVVVVLQGGGALEQQRVAARRIARGGVRERGDRLEPLRAAARQEPLEALERREIAGRLGARGEIALERRPRIPELLGDPGSVEQVLGALRPLRERRATPGEGEQLGGGSRRREERLERLERLRVVRHGVEHRAPGLDRRRATAAFGAEPRRAPPQEDPLLRRRRLGGLLPDVAERILVPGRPGEPLELGVHAGAGGATLREGAAPRDERHRGLPEIAFHHGADLGEQRRALRRIVHGAEAPFPRGDALRVLARRGERRVRELERVPARLTRRRRERHDCIARGGAGGVAAEQLRVQIEGARRIVQAGAA